MSQSPDIPENELRERCSTILGSAAEEARRLGHNYIGTEHLFIATTRTEHGPTSDLLRRAGFNPRHVRNEIRREIGTSDGPLDEVLPLTPRTEIVLSLAIFLAEQDEQYEVQEIHVLMALLQESEGVPIRKLIDMGFDLNLWLQKLITEQHSDLAALPISDDSDLDFWDDDDSDLDLEFSSGFLSAGSAKSDEFKAPATPLLDRYGRDLTVQAAEGRLSEALARDKEIRALARTLARSKKNNPLLLGDAGVGKTAIVEGLAYAIHNKTAPAPLLNRRIIQIEIGTLVAGTSLRGQFEERLIGIVNETKKAGNVILFIDEIHTIVGAGDTIDSNLDAANILKPALARGEIMCIGATTHAEYRSAIAQDPALDRRFRTIDVDEPSEESAIQILIGQKKRLEDHHKVIITPEAIQIAVKLSVRYLPDRRLPDKAIDLLDEACTRVIIRTIHPDIEIDELEEMITDVREEDIADVLSEWTGVPISELTSDEKRRLSNLSEKLKERVIGQDIAVRMVADAIKTARAGLNDPNRPIGVFLFLGPSGVGKTELARALAAELFLTEDAIMRLDMSEFHDSHTVARLIGSPPGYKESSRGGQLTDGLRRRPYSVVLLDEVEKAAPEVFDIFLQVFDDGRISDAHGRHVDARHSVFIMTSNIGTQEGAKSLGFMSHDEDVVPDYSGYLSQFFRPEFLNRIDEVITFRNLNHDTLDKILDLQLTEVHERLAEQKLKLSIDPSARQVILDAGYDPANGARPLRRAIERLLTRPLSTNIVNDDYRIQDTIVVHASEDKQTLAFTVQDKSNVSSTNQSSAHTADK